MLLDDIHFKRRRWPLPPLVPLQPIKRAVSSRVPFLEDLFRIQRTEAARLADRRWLERAQMAALNATPEQTTMPNVMG